MIGAPCWRQVVQPGGVIQRRLSIGNTLRGGGILVEVHMSNEKYPGCFVYIVIQRPREVVGWMYKAQDIFQG